MYHTQGVAPCCWSQVAEVHELSLCQSAVEIIQRQAEQRDVAAHSPPCGWKFGALSCVESAVRFSFEIVSRNGGARVAVHLVYRPGRPGAGIAARWWIRQHDGQCPICHGERLRVDTSHSLMIEKY
ncbi:hydrogenase/urease maturation nickel metallochaperone HypA [Escherichia coli]